MAAPHVKTERLLLTELKQDDANDMFTYRSLPEVHKYQNWVPKNADEVSQFIRSNQATQYNQEGSWYQLAIRQQEPSVLIGDVGLHFLADSPRQVEIGITISPTHQGKGYATETINALLKHLFGKLDKHRVIGSVDPRNKASIALLETLGFRKEAHFKQSLWFKGEWVDDLIYAILQCDWQEK